MRGTRTPASRESVQNGIIPAYAGNTYVMTVPLRHEQDHPRVCGEHPNTATYEVTASGSSPRMRGTLLILSRAGSVFGIIPAYAGNTLR